jgi:hypothetical protein
MKIIYLAIDQSHGVWGRGVDKASAIAAMRREDSRATPKRLLRVKGDERAYVDGMGSVCAMCGAVISIVN